MKNISEEVRDHLTLMRLEVVVLLEFGTVLIDILAILNL